MPDLRIGKIIFENNDNRSCKLSRIIVQLSSDYMELSLIEETNVGNNINKAERSYKIPSLMEYMELERLFVELIPHSIREITDPSSKESRLDYIFRNGEREIYLINDKEGNPVIPWLNIVKILEEKLGITELNIHKSNLQSKSKNKQSRSRTDFENEVLSIIENIGRGNEFTVDDIRDEIIKNIEGTLNSKDLKKLFDKIWNVLRKLTDNGVIIKINSSKYRL